jgi:hypothetical protein
VGYARTAGSQHPKGIVMQIAKAVRRALPMQLAFYGPSGSGKTLSALLMAAGLSPNGKVAVIDTERGRASLYADNKRVTSALPNGFDVTELDQPYHPQRYIEAMDLVEGNGYEVCIIDSGSDSWDGPGGCSDIAEKAKGMWNGAKLWNKRMMTRSALSNMHIIWCLKAQEKTKVIDKTKSGTGKQEYIDMGVLPIWEKNNFYPMLMGFSVDPKTHLATAVKCHDDLWQFFSEPRLITKLDGEKLRNWNESGQFADPNARLRERARLAAGDGMKAYLAFFKSLTNAERQILVATDHEKNKEIADRADAPPADHIGEQPDGTLRVA